MICRSPWLGGAQEEPTPNSSVTSPGMESLRRIELPMYASSIVHISLLTLAQAMSVVDRANFVLKRSQAYEDMPQYVESFLHPVSKLTTGRTFRSIGHGATISAPHMVHPIPPAFTQPDSPCVACSRLGKPPSFPPPRGNRS